MHCRQDCAQHDPERGTEQLKELKRQQKENERLRRAASDLILDRFYVDALNEAIHKLGRPDPTPKLASKMDGVMQPQTPAFFSWRQTTCCNLLAEN